MKSNAANLELFKTILVPVSKERLAEIVRGVTQQSSEEQLTLEDAGLTGEVRQFFSEISLENLKNALPSG